MVKIEFTSIVIFEHKPERVTQTCRYLGKKYFTQAKSKGSEALVWYMFLKKSSGHYALMRSDHRRELEEMR